MRYGEVSGVGKPVSRLVQGIGSINTREIEGGFALLDSIFELGCNTFDTAHVYGGGESERALGQWMRERQNRDRVVVITKGAHHNQDRKRVTPFDIKSDLKDSLARLKTDYIDIYLLHRDDPAVPVGPIMEVLNEHLRAGEIKAFGGSNWRHERLQEANDYARSHGLVPFAASSPNFGLAVQVKDPWGPGCVSLSGPKEAGARAWYGENQMPVFAYSSLARGLFSGRITRENFESIKDSIDKVCLNAYCYEENFQRLDRTRILAAEKGLTVPQVALAYLMNQPLNTFALVGAANGDEFKACADALDVELSSAEIEWLDLRWESR